MKLLGSTHEMESTANVYIQPNEAHKGLKKRQKEVLGFGGL